MGSRALVLAVWGVAVRGACRSLSLLGGRGEGWGPGELPREAHGQAHGQRLRRERVTAPAECGRRLRRLQQAAGVCAAAGVFRGGGAEGAKIY
jgi:hypothetical protein